MKYVVSRYNHDISWLPKYTSDFIIYDRSEQPVTNSIVVPNLGSDISDKLRFIIDNYSDLPDVAVYTKANLFKYITPEEFDEVKDNKTFTPLLTQRHKTYLPICWYEKGLYAEKNDYFYIYPHPAKSKESFLELLMLLKMHKRKYNLFSPGSSYILTREDILKHPKDLYIKLKSYLDWTVYPGEAQMLERSLYYLWGTDIITGI